MKIWLVTKTTENHKDLQGKYINGIVRIPGGFEPHLTIEDCVDEFTRSGKFMSFPNDLWIKRKELYGVVKFKEIEV